MPLDSTLTILEPTCRRMARSFPLRGCFEGRQESNRLCGTFINRSNYQLHLQFSLTLPFRILTTFWDVGQPPCLETGSFQTHFWWYDFHIFCSVFYPSIHPVSSQYKWSLCYKKLSGVKLNQHDPGTHHHHHHHPTWTRKTCCGHADEKSTPVTSVSSSRVSKTRSRPLSSGDSLTTHKRWTLRTQTSQTGTLFIFSEWKWKSFESRFSK